MEPEQMLVYFESQTSALCGVHALNALVQARVFTEVDLATMAAQLGDEEREMMARAGVDSVEYLTFMAADSAHVSDDGNYSVEVLRRALVALGLDLVPLVHPELATARADPAQEDGFLLNNGSHWFALRRLGGTWYNLNSLLDAPEVVGDLYLSTFIETLVRKGWTALVVRGTFPMPEQFTAEFDPSAECWRRPTDARAAARVADGSLLAAPRGRDETDDEDVEMAAAIRASMAMAADVSPQVVVVSDDDDAAQMRQALALSMEH